MDYFDPDKPQFVNLAPPKAKKKKLKRSHYSLPSLKKQAKGLKTYMNLNSVSVIMHILAHTEPFATYFEDGKLNSIYRYKEGKLNGLSEHWNSEGVLIFEGEYCNGKQHGKFIKYYDNGKLRLKQHFVDGVLEGFKESYDEEGNVVKTFYEKGVATKRKLA